MGRPFWFRGALWNKIIRYKFPGIDVTFRDDGTIEYIPKDILLELCEFIAKVIYGDKYRKHVSNITVFFTGRGKPSYRRTYDILDRKTSNTMGFVRTPLVAKNFFHMVLQMDVILNTALSFLRSSIHRNETVGHTLSENSKALAEVEEQLEEVVPHEFYHNVETIILGREEEAKRWETHVENSLGKFKTISMSLLGLAGKLSFSYLYINMRHLVMFLFDAIKYEGYATFCEDADYFAVNERDVKWVYNATKEDAEKMEMLMDDLVEVWELSIQDAFDDVDEKYKLFPRGKKMEMAEKIFAKEFDKAKAQAILNKMKSETYHVGASMVQTILLANPHLVPHDVAKMSAPKLFRKYDAACTALGIKPPLATYDGDGVFDIKRHLRRLKKMRNFILGRREKL